MLSYQFENIGKKANLYDFKITLKNSVFVISLAHKMSVTYKKITFFFAIALFHLLEKNLSTYLKIVFILYVGRVAYYIQSNWKRKAIIGGYLLQVKIFVKNQRIGQEFKHLSFTCMLEILYTQRYFDYSDTTYTNVIWIPTNIPAAFCWEDYLILFFFSFL